MCIVIATILSRVIFSNTSPPISGKEPFKIEIKEVPDADKDGAINLDDVEHLLRHDKNTATPLKSNGDFRSDECIELLKQADIVVTNPPFSGAILELQQNRKKIISVYGEKLVGFQWAIVIVLALLLIVSFNLVPATSIFTQALKVLFGIAVFISVILLKQLDDLTLFGEHAGEHSAKDIFRIIDEKDVAELKSK